MISLADNPAVTDPKRSLNVSERRALLAIRDYRRQYTTLTGVMLGPVKTSDATVLRLRVLGLVRGNAPNLNLTEAGRIAADRLSKKSPKAQGRTAVADRSAPRPEDSAAAIREDKTC